MFPEEAHFIGSVLYNADEKVATCVLAMLPHLTGRWAPGMFRALGVFRRGQLIGGVVFHDYNEARRDISITAAFTSPAWCLPDTMRQIMAYPLDKLKCTRCTARTTRGNKAARAFNERLGFKVEGVSRSGPKASKKDIIMYGVLLEELKWKR